MTGAEPMYYCLRCPAGFSPAQEDPMSYDEFKNEVRRVLVEVGRPIQWGEIRQRAGLQQKFPNNQWVKRMEADIGLVREIKAGKTLWRLK